MRSAESIIGPSHVASQVSFYSGVVSRDARPWSALIILHAPVFEYRAPAVDEPSGKRPDIVVNSFDTESRNSQAPSISGAPVDVFAFR